MTEELGKGSFATVMKAMSKESGHFYAVKMIQVNHVRTAASVSQVDGSGARSKPDPAVALHKEVKILERLKHPHICQLKEVFYEEHYISMSVRLLPRDVPLTVVQTLYLSGSPAVIFLNIYSREMVSVSVLLCTIRRLTN